MLFSFYTSFGAGRGAGFAVWTEVVLTSVAPTYLPTSLSWLTGYSALEKSGLKEASPSGPSDLPLLRLQQRREP